MRKPQPLGVICALVLAFALTCAVQPAAALSIVSDFESGPGLDGWSGRTGNFVGWFFDDLDPSNHFLEYFSNPNPHIVGGSPLFRGDLSAFDGGTLSFDVRFGAAVQDLNGDIVIIGRERLFVGEITLTTGAGAFVLPGLNSIETPNLEWYTYTVDMNAATWGIDPTTWLLGLQNVTDLQINLGIDPTSLTAGFSDLDNVRLDAIPIPATVWLFGSALGMLGWMRRKLH